EYQPFADFHHRLGLSGFLHQRLSFPSRWQFTCCNACIFGEFLQAVLERSRRPRSVAFLLDHAPSALEPAIPAIFPASRPQPLTSGRSKSPSQTSQARPRGRKCDLEIAGTISRAVRNTPAFAALLPGKQRTAPVTGLGEFDRRGPHVFREVSQGDEQWRIPIT